MTTEQDYNTIRDALKQPDAGKLVEALEEALSWSEYETEYDGRMYTLCHSCGGQDGEHKSDCSVDKYYTLLAAYKKQKS